VKLRHAALEPAQERGGITPGGRQPAHVDFEIDRGRIALAQQDFPASGLADGRELEVVVVIAERNAEPLQCGAALVEQGGGALPDIVAGRGEGPPDGLLDVLARSGAEALREQRDRQDAAPGAERGERCGDFVGMAAQREARCLSPRADGKVQAGDRQARFVGGGADLRRRVAIKAGHLDLPVADRGDLTEGRVEIATGVLAQGVDLQTYRQAHPLEERFRGGGERG